MPKTLVSMMPRLSQPERDRAIGMLQAGRDRRAVARLLGVRVRVRVNPNPNPNPKMSRTCGIQTHTFDFTKFGQKPLKNKFQNS